MNNYSNPIISLLLFFFFIGMTSVEAQNISINADGSAPDNSAMLDISSSTRGLLVPRMTFLERTLILNPANSLLIYQTDNTPGYYYNSGTTAVPVWVQIGAPDNLGNHIATTNIQLGTNYLSGDGDSEGIYIDNTGNIGVGTATPSGKIDIVDNTEEFSINITNSTNSATDKKGVFSIVTGGGIGDSYGIYGEANAATGDKFGVFGGAVGAGGIKYGLYGDASGAGTNWAGYFNNGNVYIDNLLGIGITPTNALSVAGNIDADTAFLDGLQINSLTTAQLTVSSNTFPASILESSSTNGSWLAIGNTSTGGQFYQLISTGSTNGEGVGKMLFGFGNAANSVNGIAMVFSDSLVGIGTSAPDVKLHLDGGINANYTAGSGFLQIGPTSGNNLIFDGNELLARNNGAASDLFLQRNGGNLAIGTATADSLLDVGGGAEIDRLSIGGSYSFPTTVPNSGDIMRYDGTNLIWGPNSTQNLSSVLAAGNDAGADSIFNLNALTIGSQRASRAPMEVDSVLIIDGNINGISVFGSNLYNDGTNLRYLNDGFADAYGINSGVSGIFHWVTGIENTVLPGDPASFVRLEDNRVVISGDSASFEIELKGLVFADSLRINNSYSFPNTIPSVGEVLQYDGTNLGWATLSGDNLGNHTASTNIQLGTNYLSGDGDNEGIYIANNGDVGVGSNTPSGKLDVAGDGSFLGGLRVSGTTAATVGASIYIDGANQDWTIYGSNNSAGSGANKLVFRDYTNAADRMAIDNAGNLGIGTTNPSSLLHAHSTGSSGNLRLTSASTGTSTTDGFSITNNGSTRVAMRQHENADWQFITHTGTTALTIDPTANVGIGTTSPAYLLDVNGSARITNLRVNTTNLQFGAAMEVANRANIIGAGSPNLFIGNSGSNYVQLLYNSAGYGQLFTPGTNDLVLSAGGNVGIGITNPSSELEVAGDIEIPAANDYTYSTAKTHYQSYAPTTFNSLLPDVYGYGTNNAANFYGYFRSGGTAFGYSTVAVNLPDGATVTELEGWIYDNISSNPVRVSLYRQQLGSSAIALMAQVESTTLNASTVVQNLTDNTVFNAVIDNERYAYFLFFTGRQNSTDTRLYGTKITYTVTETD